MGSPVPKENSYKIDEHSTKSMEIHERRRRGLQRLKCGPGLLVLGRQVVTHGGIGRARVHNQLANECSKL